MQLTKPFSVLATLLLTGAALVQSVPTAVSLDKRDTTVSFDGRSFVNKGLVGFGRISASSVDKFGETLGGLGSSIFVESLQAQRDGTYRGVIRLNPDRGHNTVVTTDYRARTHTFSFTYDPSKGNATTENIGLTYEATTLFRTNPGFNYTTGLDALSSRPSTFVSPTLPIAPSDNHVSFDVEGWAPSNVGTLSFLSDEYGPYIYTLEPNSGIVLAATAPPQAVLPYIGGKLNFTSQVNPDTGRAPNQGFEGLTFDRSTDTLWALLQSATIQDSDNGSKTSNLYTRLFGYDASNPLKLRLKSEYVVPLPQNKKSGKTFAQSELHVVDSNTFLVLARDGNGYGDTNSKSAYKQADLISTKGATNIANTKYDQPQNPITPDKGATLNADITPVVYQSFVNLIEDAQLAKFGLQNGGKIDRTLIASKLESLAVANLMDANTEKPTGDQLLFVVSDNDFITANGHQAAQVADGSYQVQPYSDSYAVTNGADGDTQVFIYRVTLPGYNQGKQTN
jgi:hypothetical protein